MLVSLNAQTTLPISTDKTTSLIFPFAIRHVDRGTRAILVHQVAGADHILLVKAGEANFPETNLSVITGDGSLYSFIVNFDPHPPTWVYELPARLSASIGSYANSVLDNPATTHRVSDRKWKIHARVAGIYVKGDILFYQLVLSNRTPIDYDIDFLRFYIRDRKKAKQTAIQENELPPVYVAGNNRQVKAHATTTIVFALQKFTIPDAQYVGIEVGEKNGGRNLSLKVDNRHILQAISLPDQR